MTNAFRILIVEDDRLMRQSLVELLDAAGWQSDALPRAERVEGFLAHTVPDVILSDVRMPGMSGLDLLRSLSGPDAPPLVLISAHGDIPMAVEVIKAGAYSFVEKPYEPRRLLTILRHAAEQSRMRQSNLRLKERLLRLSGLDRILLGQTPEISAVRQEILDLADTTDPVLIQGETGTGKELVARALHDLGPNADQPFFALNCAVLSPETFELEMFGRADGPKGRMVVASGGTLFMDEVCACPLPVQAQLLRVLEEGQVYPQGSATPVPVRLRIVSATNENVESAVADGRLRQDLLFRLNTMVVQMPSLRQRLDDLNLLATHFLQDSAQVYEIAPPEITHDDLSAMMTYDWPGNVRELRSVAQRRVLAARRGGGSFAEAIRRDAAVDEVPGTLREAVASFERELIGNAIRAHEGRMDAAAEALGIGRRTLNEKIVKLGLDKDALL